MKNALQDLVIIQQPHGTFTLDVDIVFTSKFKHVGC